ncbi:MAG: right-handed parallel beta-helix repeat-containing protein [Deltaproteobacteria bacterium]|nr:right-handed parallel beta-helix repeat-containing protein [Deltaproteobacteria bacterium]
MTSTYDAAPTPEVGPAPGTLRYCIEIVDSTDADDTLVDFDIPGTGPHTIQLATCLTIGEDGTTVDGFSQPGASPASSTEDALHKIILDGSSNDCGVLLSLRGSDAIVRGLVLENQSSASGPVAHGYAIEVGNATAGTVIQGNRFEANAGGIEIGAGSAADHVTVGGTTAASRNVITGCSTLSGIEIGPGEGNVIAGNHVVGNDHVGISVTDPELYGGRDHRQPRERERRRGDTSDVARINDPVERRRLGRGWCHAGGERRHGHSRRRGRIRADRGHRDWRCLQRRWKPHRQQR